MGFNFNDNSFFSFCIINVYFRIMKFKIEIWHSTTEYQEIEINAIDAIYALKFAKEMYPTATKINVIKVL